MSGSLVSLKFLKINDIIAPMKTKLIILTTLSFIAILTMSTFANADTVILPHRVIDARTHTVIDFEGLLARCSEAQVVTLGEQHDDPGTHAIELAILEGLHRYHPYVILSMEMFERDVQEVLDDYLAGNITEEEFLANSRPWGNYDTDYRPMIEFALTNQLQVVAANIPRTLASRVGQMGLDMSIFEDDELPPPDVVFEAPKDAYFEIFSEIMNMMGVAHGAGMPMTDEMIWGMYQAQVFKDETMAASVSVASRTNPGSIVYHVAGAFHLAGYMGTFPRIKRNLPGVDAVSILAYPVDDLMVIPDDLDKADYWILVQAPPYEEEIEETEEMEDTSESEMPAETSEPGTDESGDDEENSQPVFF